MVNKDTYVYNPCVEIGMIPSYNNQSGWQSCNLTEINGSKCNTKEQFFTACKVASILGTFQASYTDLPYLGKISEEIHKKEALLGVSITGFMNNPKILLDEKI